MTMLCCIAVKRWTKKKWCNILCQLKLFSLRQLFGIVMCGGRHTQRMKKEETSGSSHDMAMKNVFRIMNATSAIDFHTGNSTTIYPFSRHNTKTKGKPSGMRMKNYRRQMRTNVGWLEKCPISVRHACLSTFLTVFGCSVSSCCDCNSRAKTMTLVLGILNCMDCRCCCHSVVTYNYTSHFARIG